MSTATTTEPDVLRSRLPDPSRYFPDLGALAEELLAEVPYRRDRDTPRSL
jgi:hypothetical protein